jgi:dolichyl-phosphate-mannose-protein mannosyltransferase
MMNRKAIKTAIKQCALFLTILLCSILPSSLVFAENGETNIVINGSFEEVNLDEPANWTRDAYLSGEANSQLKVMEGDAHSGSRFATVESAQPNDVKWTQTVSVKPDTLYKLSCWVRVVQVDDEGATGANISILGIGTTSRDLKTSSGSWELLEFVGRTGAEQEQVTVAVRLGSYGNLNSGKADFDDFRMELLDVAPSGAVVVPLDPAVEQGGTVVSSEAGSSYSGYSDWMIFYGIAYAVLCFYLISRFRNQKSKRSDLVSRTGIKRLWLVIILFGSAFLIRIVCAPMIQGHPIDVFDFLAWADHAYRNGLSGFYNGKVFADYPPGYIYVLYMLGLIQSWLNLEPASSASLILIKFPAMVADLVAGWFIYRMALRLLDERTALLAALLYVLNPLVFLDSVVWGQMDSVFCLFIVLMVLSLQNKRLPVASVLFVVAVLIKPQSLIFAPLLLLSIRTWKETVKAALYSLFVFIVITLPFTLQQGPWWIFKHYQAMFGLYPYATFNAFNLYSLLGANGVKMDQKWWGIPFASWDILFIVAIVLVAGTIQLRSRKEGKIFYVAFLIALLIFAFKTGLHERYGYATVPLALMSWLWIRDKRVFYLFLGVSITNFANVAYVLKFGLHQNYFIPNGDGFMNLIALSNVCLALYAVWVSYELLIKKPSSEPVKAIKPTNAIKPTKAIKPTNGSIATHSHFSMSRKDYITMTTILIVYASIALFQLGSSVAPLTVWILVSLG